MNPQIRATPQTITGATLLPQFAGNVYTVNDPARGNLEFSIAHFSQLYQDITGKPLTPNTVIYVGGFAGSDTDFPISKAFIPSQPVLISAATSPNTCPPASPPILINPHEHRVIDTAHRDLVRVTVEGTSGFDVTSINPATVALNGALPIAQFTRHFPHSEFLNETFVFRRLGYPLARRLYHRDLHRADLQRPADHLVQTGLEHPVLGEGPGPAPFPVGQGFDLPAICAALRGRIRARSRLVTRPSPFRPRSRST